MKKAVFYVILISTILLVECVNKEKLKPIATGMPGDVVVVLNDRYWNSVAGDSLRSVFEKYEDYCMLEEHVFDLHQIPNEKFIEKNRLHRNVIYQEICSDTSKQRLTVYRDRFAQKQIFVNLAAHSQEEFARIISENGDELIKLFKEEDRNRWVNMLKTHYNKTVSEKLRQKYSININIPINYYLNEYRDDFAWVSHEARNYTMNILVYSWELTDTSSLDAKYLIEKRNESLKKNVPGERAGSYMTTETKFAYPSYEKIIHNGVETGVLRGMWKVQKDFMGGSFVSYTKVDNKRNRMICVEGFVYYPNNEVRDKIRLLEGVLYTYSL